MSTLYKTSIFGYNKQEVEEELAEHLNQIKRLNKEISRLQEEIDELKHENEILVNRDTINQKTNEEIARLALKEASNLIDKAKRNANMILKESMEYVRGLDSEVSGFKDNAKLFRAQVVKISEELLETIDNSEIFSLIKEEENTRKETGSTKDF